MDIQIIVAPIIGGTIGLITNVIAIKMLFRPLYPKYLFGRQLPFTPGLIPKEKNRLALSLGSTISNNLMNREVLEKVLLSGDLCAKITDAIDSFVDHQSRNEQSLREFLYGILSKEEIDAILQSGKADLSGLLHNKLANAQMGGKISQIVVEHAIKKVHESLLGVIGADKLISLMAKPAENLLAKNINEMLQNNSKQLVGDLLEQESSKLLSMRMCDLIAGRREQFNQFKGYVLSAYKKLVTEYLPRALEALNISKIVENRISEMDAREMEKVVLQVMNKELNAIIWLGGILGFLMGFAYVL